MPSTRDQVDEGQTWASWNQSHSDVTRADLSVASYNPNMFGCLQTSEPHLEAAHILLCMLCTCIVHRDIIKANQLGMQHSSSNVARQTSVRHVRVLCNVCADALGICPCQRHSVSIGRQSHSPLSQADMLLFLLSACHSPFCCHSPLSS